MGEAMNKSLFSMSNSGDIQNAHIQRDALTSVVGFLPDAPIPMPSQILEQPSRLNIFLRGLLQRSLGHAET